MRIYTSRYGNKKIKNLNIIPVQISLWFPRFRLDYKIAYKIKELAPQRQMLDMAMGEYKLCYLTELDKIKIPDLDCLLHNAKKDTVLLCFEDLNKPGEWCHRRIFAEWWEQQTGEKIDEL